MSEFRQYTTFYLDDLFFGVEVERVQEIIRCQEMTRVPLAPEVVDGLINLRGQIVTAVDMRRRLELPPRPTDHQPINVVLHTDDGAISMLVDAIDDVLEVEDDRFEAPPETLTGVARELIRGAYKLDDRLLLVLDAEKALSVAV
jgi:purine-binding chemotaxis protein CheW